jgi:hypothetical protein
METLILVTGLVVSATNAAATQRGTTARNASKATSARRGVETAGLVLVIQRDQTELLVILTLDSARVLQDSGAAIVPSVRYAFTLHI